MGGNDTLEGGAGSDSLDGGTGADMMMGGTGDDIYVVDNIGDQVIENFNEGNDTVQAKINNYMLGNNVENLVLVGVVTGTGNAGNNRLTGTNGANSLFGMGGSDTLDGGQGNDTLNGGGGGDTYVFGPNFGKDTINGFDVNGDSVLLDHTVFPNAANLASAISQDPNNANNALFTANGGNTILFVGVTANDLKNHTNDFTIV
jgi:Ca2+-binding RTX toxin-like protein